MSTDPHFPPQREQPKEAPPEPVPRVDPGKALVPVHPALDHAARVFESALARFRSGLLARSRQPPIRPRATWCGPGGVALGSIEPAVAQALANAGLPWKRLESDRGGAAPAGGADPALGRWQVGQATADPARQVDGLSDALERTARWLHEQGLGGRWRHEALTVTDAEGVEHARIERAAVRVLGVTTFAVHLCGYARGPQGEVVQWLQQRALDKATDPGLWDTLMGGQCGAGEWLAETLERETWEEAGLRLQVLQGLREAGRCSFERPVSDGWLVEHIDLFEAWVPEGVSPLNQDGEVECFELAGTEAVVERFVRDEVTLEAALMMARAVRPRSRD